MGLAKLIIVYSKCWLFAILSYSLFFDDGRADLADLIFDILKPKVSLNFWYL
jgi:hypothetical protein